MPLKGPRESPPRDGGRHLGMPTKAVVFSQSPPRVTYERSMQLLVRHHPTSSL